MLNFHGSPVQEIRELYFLIFATLLVPIKDNFLSQITTKKIHVNIWYLILFLMWTCTCWLFDYLPKPKGDECSHSGSSFSGIIWIDWKILFIYFFRYIGHSNSHTHVPTSWATAWGQRDWKNYNLSCTLKILSHPILRLSSVAHNIVLSWTNVCPFFLLWLWNIAIFLSLPSICIHEISMA